MNYVLTRLAFAALIALIAFAVTCLFEVSFVVAFLAAAFSISFFVPESVCIWLLRKRLERLGVQMREVND